MLTALREFVEVFGLVLGLLASIFYMLHKDLLSGIYWILFAIFYAIRIQTRESA